MFTNKKFISFFVILLLPFLYTFFILRYGLEDSDSGFIVGMGWRIINGEFPYRDFIYIRPPLTPYISALYLKIIPEFAQVFILRLINSYQLFIQVFLTLLILRKFYDFKALKIHFFIFSGLCYLVTASGTLYFQWHTTDGIFFGVLGLFLITYFNKYNLVLIVAGLCFSAAFLTKQNFLVVPIFGVLFVCLQYGTYKSMITSVGILIGIGLFYNYLFDFDLHRNYISQTTGVTNLKDLFIAGFLFYFIKHDFLFLYLVSIIFSYLCFYTFYNYKSNLNSFKIHRDSILLFLSIFYLFIFNISYVLFFESRERMIAFDRILPVIVALYFTYLLAKGRESISNHLALIILLGFSWSSSISWGGMTPIMFFTPVIFLCYYLLKTFTDSLKYRYINASLILMIAGMSISNNLVSYRSGFIWSINNNGELLTPKLAFIKVNDVFFAKHNELKNILRGYPNSTLLPSMPGAYYLYNKKNHFIIDWPMDVESNFDSRALLESINQDCEFVIVEKKCLGQPIGESGKFYSSITNYVLKNFEIVDSKYEFFNVYKK